MINLISSQPNIRYYSGFTGSVGILIGSGSTYLLIVDGRYTAQAKEEVIKGTKVIEAPIGINIWEPAINFLKKKKISRLGYEEDKIDVATFNKIKAALPGVEFYSISKEIRGKRIIKHASEIELIAKAALIADLTFDCMIHIIKPGMTELEVSAHIDYLMKIFKSENPAFETLVSSGKLSAYPHGKPTDKKILKGDIVVMDFGARYKGYNSDITRMVSLAAPDKKRLKIFNAVLKAQEAAISIVRDGVSASVVDSAARGVLAREKLGRYFTHGTGHGIGLQVHEAPRVSLKSEDILKEGMVMTVEPGVYIPGIGGFRIEDMVLVERSGCRVLTRSPKSLKVIT
jgi:Xaa-Pro aminopeptidase